MVAAAVNMQDMLERLPTIAIADLKSRRYHYCFEHKGADPSRLTAISLVTGADTLLNHVGRQATTSRRSGDPKSGGRPWYWYSIRKLVCH